MKKVIICFLILLSVTNLYAQIPGGVSESEIWSRVIKNTATANFEYKDFSKKSKAINLDAGVVLDKSLFNYNYSYTYDQNDFVWFLTQLETMKDATIFIVNKPLPPTIPEYYQYTLMNSNWKTDVFPPVGLENQMKFEFTTGYAKKENNLFASYPPISFNRLNARIDTFLWHDFNSRKILNSYGNIGESKINVGKQFGTTESFKGEIPEFIVFRRALNDKEKLRIESYLALKYGITLQSGVDYLSARNAIYWHKGNNNNFGKRIFGIGRDSKTDLYQRQSTSAHDFSKLIFWTGSLVEDNYINTTTIDDHSYLTIGDNNLSESLDTILKVGIQRIDRIWLNEKFGTTTHNLVTNLKYKKENTISLSPDQAFWLIIDRSANTRQSNFNGQNIDYYHVTGFDSEGYAVYENLKWATASNTYNQFTFGVGPKMILVPKIESINCTQSKVTISIKGEAQPIFHVNIQGVGNSYSSQFDTLNNSFFKNLNVGNYIVSVTDSSGFIAQTTFTVTTLPEVELNLGPDFEYQSGFNYTLNAGLEITAPNYNYSWYKNGVLDSSSTTNTYTILNPPSLNSDVYTCTITNQLSGCSISDDVVVSNATLVDKNKYSFVYPNPSTSNFTVEILFPEIKDFELIITDVTGKVLKTDRFNGLKNYKKDYSFLVSGVYFVYIKSEDYTKTHKVIINN